MLYDAIMIRVLVAYFKSNIDNSLFPSTVYNGILDYGYSKIFNYSLIYNFYPEKEFLQIFLKKFFEISFDLGTIKIVKTEQYEPFIFIKFENESLLRIEYPLEDKLNPYRLDGHRIFRVVRTRLVDKYGNYVDPESQHFDFSSNEEFHNFLYYIYNIRFS